jgi:hypothetical protein
MLKRSSTVMILPFEKMTSGAGLAAPGPCAEADGYERCDECRPLHVCPPAALADENLRGFAALDNPSVGDIIGAAGRLVSRAAQEAGMKTLRFIVAITLVMSTTAAAQWLKYPTAGIPRMPDGKPDLAAPVPRSESGRPVLAGLWRPAPGIVGDITRGLKGGEVPYQPWAEAVFKERRANDSRDDPTARCIVGGVPRSDFVGYPFRILETSGVVTILYEAVHSYRQIFTDGRSFPKDPNPAWFGYSVGRWDGDAFVVESSGFNDNVWLDNAGRPATAGLRVTERFVRKNFGQMDLEVTIDDPKAYTKPWSVTQQLAFQADTELLEYICNENNKYFEIIPKSIDR